VNILVLILVLALLFIASVSGLHVGHCPGGEQGICITWRN
jgi:hypothetical protein